MLITSEMGHKQTSCRPRSPAMSADLAFVDARGGCGVVLVVTPRRMMEMDDEVAVVRSDGILEHKLTIFTYTGAKPTTCSCI